MSAARGGAGTGLSPGRRFGQGADGGGDSAGGGGRGGVTRPCALRPRPEPRPSVSQERELQ